MNIEQYCLLKIIEEAAEIQKVAAKMMQFGAESTDPNVHDSLTNIEELRLEANDLYGSLQALQTLVGHRINIRQDLIDAKVQKIMKYLSISKNLGKVHE